MAFVNTQKSFDTTGARLERTLNVITNGGSVEVECSYDGIEWVRTDILSDDGGYVLFQGKTMIRITPLNGAEYEYI